MKKLVFALIMLLAVSSATFGKDRSKQVSTPTVQTTIVQPITFSNTLPVSKSNDITKPGCQTSTSDYIFNVTMLGWNSPTSTCTSANVFPVQGYLTSGQRASRSFAQAWFQLTTVGKLFSLSGITFKNYGSGNILYVDTTKSDGTTYTTTIPASTVGITFNTTLPEFSSLASVSIRSTNNRFDITNLIVK